MKNGQSFIVIEGRVREASEPVATAPSTRELSDTIPEGREATISGALAVERADRSSTDPQHDKKQQAAAKQFRLGVLLVHGIGTQPPRDTLVRWGDVLMKIIGRATKNQVKAIIERGRPGDESGDKPAEIQIRIRGEGNEERWLLAEGWWAGSFPAPSYRELVSWSVRAVPWSIAIHIAQRYWQEGSRTSAGAKLIALATALVQLLIALALAPVFIFLLALALLLGVLPIPQLRTVILSAQSTLTGTVGDSLAFVESPVRAAFIGTRILEGLERLKATCEHTVIVAHSQGAAVVLAALGGFVESDDEPNTGDGLEPPPAGLVPDALLTFGSGINQLASLKLLSAGLPKKLGFNPANFAVVAMLVTAGLFGLLYADVQAQRTTVASILKATVLWIVYLGVVGLLFWAALKLSKLAGSKWLRGTLVALILVPILAVMIYANILDLPFGSVNILLFALMVLAGSLKMILSSDMKEVVTKRVRKPVGLTGWIDLYASADPVPNGKTRAVEDPTMESVQIWNRGSQFSDHTAYWDNLDGFVLRVTRVCAQTARSEWQDRLPRERLDVDQRAAWRVGFLRLARGINALAWLFVFALLWKRHEQRVPMPFDLPAWLPAAAATVTRFALLAAVVTLAAWATSRILLWPWTLWVRSEQEKALAGVSPSGKPWVHLIVMEMIVAMVLLLAYKIARGDSSVWSELRADPGEVIIAALIFLFGGAWILAAFALRLMPEPRPPEAHDP